MDMPELVLSAICLGDQEPLKYDTKHKAEVYFNRPVLDEIWDGEAAEALAAAIVLDTYVKSQPYPFHMCVDVTAGSDKAIVYWTEDDEERFIEGPNEYYWNKNVGDTIFYENAAPGIGHAKFRIDRKDDTGLWGICIEDTRWIPNGDFYR